jgi:N-acetylmuramoyl-L-alanine amidase
LTPEPDSPLVTLFCPSPNHEPRKGGRTPDLLLLHYTGMITAEASLERLTDDEARVSSHYLIDEDGRITQMVREDLRAWHAGASHWAGEDDINSCSIGIEIHNPGHEFDYPDFPEIQMRAVEALCLDILSRNTIPPERVLAHSDIAPARKQDPGEKFDWARLARAGIGLWVEPEPVGKDKGLGTGDSGSEVEALQRQLADYGYNIPVTGEYDDATRIVVTAFQRHFRPARVDGRADRSTCITLERLLAARFPAA